MPAKKYPTKSAYGKRPLWQWIVIYLIIGGIIYGLIFFFIIARRGGYNYNSGYRAPSSGSNY